MKDIHFEFLPKNNLVIHQEATDAYQLWQELKTVETVETSYCDSNLFKCYSSDIAYAIENSDGDYCVFAGWRILDTHTSSIPSLIFSRHQHCNIKRESWLYLLHHLTNSSSIDSRLHICSVIQNTVKFREQVSQLTSIKINTSFAAKLTGMDRVTAQRRLKKFDNSISLKIFGVEYE